MVASKNAVSASAPNLMALNLGRAYKPWFGLNLNGNSKKGENSVSRRKRAITSLRFKNQQNLWLIAFGAIGESKIRFIMFETWRKGRIILASECTNCLTFSRLPVILPWIPTVL